MRRFYAEAEAAAALDHPGIVPIHEIGEHDGEPFFSMGFVEGRSLAQRLVEGPLPALEAASVVKQVAEAVEYAHARGIVHRDLKPGNILLDANGQPRVTDFGLAKRVENGGGMTVTGQVLGTPAYMPPEQALGEHERVSPRSDVYALGAVLYAIVVGQPPFQAPTLPLLLRNVLEKEPVSLRSLNPTVPRDLDTIALKCLEKEPARRYGTAQELADDLGRLLEDRPIVARPCNWLERSLRWRRRNVGLVYVTLIFAALTVVGAGILLQALPYRSQGSPQQSLVEAKERQDLRVRFDRAANQCEKDPAAGILILADVLRNAERLQQTELEAATRRQIGAWAPHVTELREVFDGRPVFPHKACAFSLDGRRMLLASQSESHQISVAWYDVQDSREIARVAVPSPHGAETQLLAISFNADSSRVLTLWGGFRKSEIGQWDAETGKDLGKVPVDLSIRNHIPNAFSPGGRYLAVAEQDFADSQLRTRVHVRDTIHGKPICEPLILEGKVSAVSLSADGQLLFATVSNSPAQLWDTATGKLSATTENFVNDSSLKISQDGEFMGLFNKSTMGIWQIASRKWSLPPRPIPYEIRDASTFGNGTGIVVAGDAAAHVHDGFTGLPVGSALWSNSSMKEATANCDGTAILTGSSNITQLWRCAPEAMLGKPLPGILNCDDAVVNATASHILVRTGPQITIWRILDETKMTESRKIDRSDAPIDLSSDGKTALLISGTQARLIDLAAGQDCRAPIELDSSLSRFGSFSPDGSRVLIADESRIMIAETKGENISKLAMDLATQLSPLGSAQWSRDGKWVALARSGFAVAICSGTNLQPRFVHPEASIHAIDFSESGDLVACSDYGRNLDMWRLAPVPTRLWSNKTPRLVELMRISPDGQILAVASEDRTIQLFNTADGKAIGSPLPHSGSVEGMAFADQGAVLLIWSAEEAKFVDLANGMPLGPAIHHRLCRPASEHGQCSGSVVGFTRGKLRIWPVPQPIAGSADSIALWATAVTGRELAEDGDVVRQFDFLTPSSPDVSRWRKLRDQWIAARASASPD